MKVYIAAKFKNADLVNSLTDKFSKEGINNNYNWAYGLKDEETEEDLVESAKQELEAIKNADAVIYLLPLGRGGFAEFGMALMAEKPVFLCYEKEEDIKEDPINFFYLPGLKKVESSFDTIDEVLLEELKMIKPKKLGQKSRKKN